MADAPHTLPPIQMRGSAADKRAAHKIRETAYTDEPWRLARIGRVARIVCIVQERHKELNDPEGFHDAKKCPFCHIVNLHDHKGCLEAMIDEDPLSFDDEEEEEKAVAECEVTLLEIWALENEYELRLQFTADFFQDDDETDDASDYVEDFT